MGVYRGQNPYRKNEAKWIIFYFRVALFDPLSVLPQPKNLACGRANDRPSLTRLLLADDTYFRAAARFSPAVPMVSVLSTRMSAVESRRS
jgi:hypothetical protein